MIGMLIDSSEQELITKYFPTGEDGKHRYVRPKDGKNEKSIVKILKKVHKARQGPRIIRLIFLVIIFAVPILFNLLLLDRLAAQALETGLEAFTGTDVSVRKLDIKLLAGRISLERLAFASQTDPMIDEWELNDLITDVSWSSLFFRRVAIDTLQFEIALGIPRETAADYTENSDQGEQNDSASGETLLPEKSLTVFNWIPPQIVPDETAELVHSLRISADKDFQNWSSRLDEDYEAVGELSLKVSEFLSEPLPDSGDAPGWPARINEGRSLLAEIDEKRNLIDEYSRGLDKIAYETGNAMDRAREAIENDLMKIESTLSLDDGMIDNWIEAAINATIGPKMSGIYRRFSGFTRRIRQRGGTAETAHKSRGRMKGGRIVPFPVTLPPRFTIRALQITGMGIRINGKNVGIDHDLAGAPSTVSVRLEDISGMKGILSADVIIDGRMTALNLITGRMETQGWPWAIDTGDAAVAGLLALEAGFSVKDINGEIMSSEGRVEVSDWIGNEGAGPLSFIDESSPPLSFRYNLTINMGKPDLQLELDDDAVSVWGDLIADVLISQGRDLARQALLDSVDTDMKGLESLLNDWNDDKALLDSLAAELAADESELENQINKWTKKAAGDVPLPEASGVLEGLGSLFGN